jgi:aryl-alcohol dehydrogenase-like predicted oxidoreductase
MLSRREILSVLGAAPAASLLSPGRLYAEAAATFPRRLLGRTGRTVVPLALGGQASLQWTKPGIDAPDIIVRAVQLGLNYLDTANAYGASQANYGEAFRRLHLTPADANYDLALRQKLYIATKTTRRLARDPAGSGPTAVDELKRSLTFIFGDGKGNIPEGAYLDSIQVHNLTTLEQVDQVYEGFAERRSRRAERIGALAGLLDYRDGANYTGLNPEHRHWVRHIGITGHLSSPVLMSALRRDSENIIDTLLVALNANDRLCSSHQNNVLPLAVARGLGVIAMKVMADGAFYGKPPRFSRTPEDVILTVGGKAEAISCADLVRYPLSLPGVACAIIGTGRIDRDKPESDQMVANLTAALKDVASEIERRRIEKEAEARHGAATNYFQEKTSGPVQPGNVRVRRDGERVIVEWNTALAGPEPIRSYNILAGNRLLLSLPFRPQLSEAPLSASVEAAAVGDDPVTVVASEALPRWRVAEKAS